MPKIANDVCLAPSSQNVVCFSGWGPQHENVKVAPCFTRLKQEMVGGNLIEKNRPEVCHMICR